ncbi:MAG: hypothetical protein ACREJQ_01560, partial [bacterium]
VPYGLEVQRIILGAMAVLAISVFALIYTSVRRPFWFHLSLAALGFASLYYLRQEPQDNHAILALGSLLGVGLAVAVGTLVGELITKEEFLLPLGLVAAFVELLAFLGGKMPAFPQVGGQWSGLLDTLKETTGAANLQRLYMTNPEIILFALFLISARQFRLGQVLNVLILGIGFFLTIATGAWFHLNLPAIPVMVLLFFLFNWSKLRLRRDEVGISFAFLLAVVLVFALAWTYSR